MNSWLPSEEKQKIADFYLSTNSFHVAGNEQIPDQRELARWCAHAITQSKTEAAAIHQVTLLVNKNFKSVPPGQQHTQPDKYAFLSEVSDCIRGVKTPPVEKSVMAQIAELDLNKASNLLLTAPSIIALAAANKVKEFKSGTHAFDDAQVSEIEVDRFSRAIIKQYGLNGIKINGDAILTANERYDLLRKVNGDISHTCSQFGLARHAFGNEKNLTLEIHTAKSLANSEYVGFMRPHVNTQPDQAMATMSYSPYIRGKATLSQEFTRYVDYVLGRKLCEIDSTAPPLMFSKASDQHQDNLPLAKNALQNIFNQLADNSLENIKAKKSNIALLNEVFLFEVIGKEQFLTTPPKSVTAIAEALNKNNSFSKMACEIMRKTTDWKAGIYFTLTNQQNPTNGIDVINLLATTLGIDTKEASLRLFNSIGKVEGLIKEVLPYDNQMSRYVAYPGEMIKASAFRDEKIKSEASNDPSEVLARAIGRGRSAIALAHEILSEPSKTTTHSEAALDIINKNFTTLISQAGLHPIKSSANLGIEGEDLVQKALDGTKTARSFLQRMRAS